MLFPDPFSPAIPEPGSAPDLEVDAIKYRLCFVGKTHSAKSNRRRKRRQWPRVRLFFHGRLFSENLSESIDADLGFLQKNMCTRPVS